MIYEYLDQKQNVYYPKNLKSFVKDQVIKKIISEKMKPGDKLNEKEIASNLNVSITPVRETFIELACEGLISLGRYQSPTITEFDEKKTREIFEVREVLEAKAASLASLNITDEEKNELEEIFLKRDLITEKRGSDIYNDMFHTKIILASKNQKIYSLLSSIKIQIYLLSEVSRSLSGSDIRSIEGHANILKAIQRGDKNESWRYMLEHIQKAKNEILSSQFGKKDF